MSHNPNSNADTSGFNYPSAAGIPTTTESSSSSSVTMTTTHSTLNDPIGPASDRHQGKLEGEHGGAGTRADDRKGLNVKNAGYTATPVAKEEH